MRTAWLAAAFWLMILIPSASGQPFYWGVIGGTALTADLPAYEQNGAADAYGNPAYNFQHLTGPRSLILGGLLEVRLFSSFSFEADFLHRNLHDTVISTIFPANEPSKTSTISGVATTTWEFPLMLKWSPPAVRAWGRVQPFLEGGPEFRTLQNAAAVQPSRFGVAVGAGAAFQLGRIRIAPTIRYTRWDKDAPFPTYPTKPDQVEFLTSVAWGPTSFPMRVQSHRIGLGIVAGFPLGHVFDNPSGPTSERTSYLVGASAQFDLLQNLALEVDGIYKPLRAIDGFAVLTWQFPVLAKYHLAKLGRAPFVEAGPSFRAAGNVNGYNPSHYGVTAGAGVETHAGSARLSAALRYTRWAKDGYPDSLAPAPDRTNANAVELLLGVTFK